MTDLYTTPVAVSLTQATSLVPFKEAYLRKAIRRTSDNPLPARVVSGKYIIQVSDLAEWVKQEGDPA